MELQHGKVQVVWNAAGTRILKYTIEIYHKGLKAHKFLSATEIDILQNKVDMVVEKWDLEWEKLEKRRKTEKDRESTKESALLQTIEAEGRLIELDNLLLHTLDIDDTVDWKKLRRSDRFKEQEPTKPANKEREKYPECPAKSEIELKFLDKLLRSRRERRQKEHEDAYALLVRDWEVAKAVVDSRNAAAEEKFKQTIVKWEMACKAWELSKEAFNTEREQYNERIENLKKSYLQSDPGAVTEYCDLVLGNSIYPEFFPKNYELEYMVEPKILIVEYELPAMNKFPVVKEVKYIASKKELKETYISESQQVKNFDDAMYKVALRSIHELFEADKAEAIDTIAFNGWVSAVNKGTGREENNCILSLQVRKAEFCNIDLRNVEPKACFKALKGVASSKLSQLTPVRPILNLSKTDKRFVEGYGVVDSIDHATNLAAMDWEDFEHLIREVFEKEFRAAGGEVKITKASRDGGVDAVAFDPDPIRGGKIVIQAKRYTNTVGVSAVRDLYGTTMSEGATKGILVSTADYGPDAYEFAKGKPLTLLNGSNLLHLLEKHGHHAKIDIREAKKIFMERES